MYLSAQRLSFCPYALSRDSHRSRFLFPFALFCQTNTASNSSMHLCSFLKWAFIFTVLDCCLELGAIPASCSKRGCASRPVCDYILHKCSFYFNLLGNINDMTFQMRLK